MSFEATTSFGSSLSFFSTFLFSSKQTGRASERTKRVFVLIEMGKIFALCLPAAAALSNSLGHGEMDSFCVFKEMAMKYLLSVLVLVHVCVCVVIGLSYSMPRLHSSSSLLLSSSLPPNIPDGRRN